MYTDITKQTQKTVTILSVYTLSGSHVLTEREGGEVEEREYMYMYIHGEERGESGRKEIERHVGRGGQRE